MSLSQVRDYFKSRISEVDTDFREWTDGFNFENIPSTLFDKSFHILYGTLNSQALDDQFIQDTFPVEVRILEKGFRDPADGLDNAMDDAHNIRKQSVRADNAMIGQNIKNVVCDSIEGTQFQESNDNAIMILLSFSVTLIFNPRA